jgi:hypothetical protein
LTKLFKRFVKDTHARKKKLSMLMIKVVALAAWSSVLSPPATEETGAKAYRVTRLGEFSPVGRLFTTGF